MDELQLLWGDLTPQEKPQAIKAKDKRKIALGKTEGNPFE